MRFRRVILGTTVLASLFILMAGLALAIWYEREGSISQTPNMVSAYADVAASGSETGGQEYVAVVWSEGTTDPPESATHIGRLMLRWGPPGEPWVWPMTVVEGSTSSKSREPAVAVYSSTAYIAYTKNPSNWVIGYAECPYGSACTKRTVRSGSTKVGSADIAYCNGTPHVVWADTEESGTNDIWYSYLTGETWNTGKVSDDAKVDSSPSVACYGSAVHVAWIEDGRYVCYRGKDGSWGGITRFYDGGGSYTPWNTSIAAYGDYVDVVYDFRDEANPNQFKVRQWRNYLPGGACTNEIPDASTYYSSTVPGGGISEYVGYLRPSNAIYNATSQPVSLVVWHAHVGDAYEVMYSQGTHSSLDCNLSWSTPISLAVDLSKQDCSAPSIAIGITGTISHTHVVFQNNTEGTKPWDIHYTSNVTGTLMHREPSRRGVYLPSILKSYQ